ncbi:MAG: hypothetical protein WAO69_03595 [Aestuariivita sp.]|uniref:hypothetical protein n=1 Tax=Aestuariivita sp. TaxID=1872407 RepID=UPI003BAFC838
MTTFLPKEVQQDLDTARIAALRKTSRLRVDSDAMTFPVLRMWQGGFAVEAALAPSLRGHVDLYDGARHLAQCLIIASEEEAGEMRYEFKWSTEAHETAPLDFYRAPDAPVALLGKG